MTESQLKQVIEFAHQAGQRNAGIDASPKAARDYYQSLVQDGFLANVIKSHVCIVDENKATKEVYICGICETQMDLDV